MNGFAKYLIPIAIALAPAVFGFGYLQAQVAGLEDVVERHRARAIHPDSGERLARMEEQLKQLTAVRQKVEMIWQDVIYLRKQTETQP